MAAPVNLTYKYPGIFSIPREEEPLSPFESQIADLKKEKARIEESQRIFEETIYRRSYQAQCSSYCLLPLTCIGTTIWFFPYLCSCLLCQKENCCDKALDSIGCVLFQRNLENSRELCCIYCTPLCGEFPEVRHPKGFDRYTLPHERTDENLRRTAILQLSRQIDRLKEKHLRKTILSSSQEEISSIKPPSQEDLSRFKISSSQEVLLNPSPSRELMA